MQGAKPVADGVAVALVKDGDPSVAAATFREVLAYFHKFPINWIFYFDGSCEGKAALGAAAELLSSILKLTSVHWVYVGLSTKGELDTWRFGGGSHCR